MKKTLKWKEDLGPLLWMINYLISLVMLFVGLPIIFYNRWKDKFRD